MAIGMHVHPDPGAPARFSARTTTRARLARGRSVKEIAERVMGGEAAKKGTVMDTKNAGRAAPPGESLFSSLFNVAARGGKSPRVSIVCSVYGASAASSSPAASWCCVRPARGWPPMRVVVCCAMWPRRVTGERRAEVVPSVSRAIRSEHGCGPSAPVCAPRGRPRRGVHFAHRRPALPYPTTNSSLHSITR
jgi:hypothetical protein